ncbi:MAG: hypothetical protein ABW026_11900 [Microvirga sp.]
MTSSSSAFLKRVRAILLLGLILGGCDGMPGDEPDPADRPPQTLTIRVDETLHDLLRHNPELAIDFDRVADTDPIIFGDHWIKVVYDEGDHRLEFDPGRTLMIGQTAGRIESITFNPHRDALPFQDMDAFAKREIRKVEDKGWTRTYSGIPGSEDEITKTLDGTKIYATLTNGRGVTMALTVSNLSRVPSMPSYILLKNPPPRPVYEQPVYVMKIYIGLEASGGWFDYRNSVYARRLLVNGSEYEELPLKVWVDDPDWTPLKAGMIRDSERWNLPGQPPPERRPR